MKKETETDMCVDKSANLQYAKLAYPCLIFSGYSLLSIKIYNVATKELIRTFDTIYCMDFHIDGKFVSISDNTPTNISNRKLEVFDLEELTDKNVRNEELWDREFDLDGRNTILGAPSISKMLVMCGYKAIIYDFWGDREYEVNDGVDERAHYMESDEFLDYIYSDSD